MTSSVGARVALVSGVFALALSACGSPSLVSSGTATPNCINPTSSSQPSMDWDNPLPGGHRVASLSDAQPTLAFTARVPKLANPVAIFEGDSDVEFGKALIVAFAYDTQYGRVVVDEELWKDGSTAWKTGNDSQVKQKKGTAETVNGYPGLNEGRGVLWLEGNVMFEVGGPCLDSSSASALAQDV